MSFFDETDETRADDDDYSSTRERDPIVDDDRPTPPRRGGGGGGSGRRPTPSEIRHRQLGLVLVLVILVVLILLLVKGCSSGSDADGLKNYNASVSKLVGASNSLGQSALTALRSGSTLNTAGTLTTKLDNDLTTARSQLGQVKGLSVPSSMGNAQQNLVQVFQMRLDALQQIATNAQAAYTTSTASTATSNIALAAANLFASDVLYKNYVGTAIARALNKAGVTIGGTNGVTINPGQLLPDLGWLNTSTVSGWMSANASSSSSNVNKDTAGTHGHQLNSVYIGSTLLSDTGTNTISVSSAPVFTLNLVNSGENDEYDVGCQVTVSGSTSLSGTATIPETTKQKSATCNVTLSGIPPSGTYTVTATVEKVTGETNTQNNTLTFTVDFTS